MITPTSTFHLLTNADISYIESKLGVLLPEDYKEFLMTVNAASLKTSYFKGIECDLYFSSFLHQQFDLPYSMLTLNTNFAKAHEDESPIMGKEYLWIATDHGGEPIYISLLEENRGAVYFLRGDLTFQEGARLLANSFTHFLEILEAHENVTPPE